MKHCLASLLKTGVAITRIVLTMGNKQNLFWRANLHISIVTEPAHEVCACHSQCDSIIIVGGELAAATECHFTRKVLITKKSHAILAHCACNTGGRACAVHMPSTWKSQFGMATYM